MSKVKQVPQRPKYVIADPYGAQAVSHESLSVEKEIDNLLTMTNSKRDNKTKYKINTGFGKMLNNIIEILKEGEAI